MTDRRQLALAAPPKYLAGFPWIRRPQRLFRAHAARNGPWWFSSSMDGRFDLAAPAGACYLASDPVTALRERLGPTLASTGVVYDFDVEGVVISKLRAPAGPPIADTAATAAIDFGVTREICTTIDYSLTQMWAAALHAARFGGIRYQPRLSTSATTFSFAFFGPAGASNHPEDPAPTRARDVAALSGIRVLGTPGRSEVRVVSPSGSADR